MPQGSLGLVGARPGSSGLVWARPGSSELVRAWAGPPGKLPLKDCQILKSYRVFEKRLSSSLFFSLTAVLLGARMLSLYPRSKIKVEDQDQAKN